MVDGDAGRARVVPGEPLRHVTRETDVLAIGLGVAAEDVDESS